MQTTGRYIINGQETDAIVEAVTNVGDTGIFIEASFGAENVQPAITPLEFTFANDAAKIIRDFIDDGRIFEGMDFKADVIGEAGTVQAINGFIDLTDGYEELNDILVKAKVKFKQSTLSLEDQIASINLDLLELEGVLTDSDYKNINYLVEKKINLVEIAVISITLFLMIKELAESIEKLGADIAVIQGILAAGATGSIGSAAYAIAIALVRAAYTAILLKSVIDLMNDLLSYFISPVRQLKGLNYKRILEIGFNYLGYGFETDIPELDKYTYLPSIKGEPNETGKPNAQDYGYNFGEMVSLIRRQFNAKIAVSNNVVQFRSENSDYWLKTSSYIMPDVLLDENNPKGYNTDELTKSRIIQYSLDDLDNWTLDNYQGTQYTIITQSTSDIDLQKSGLVGFEETLFPVCLGNRKENLNALEEALKILAKAADTLMGAFGSSKRYSDRVARRVGMLKISQEQTSKPKCIYLDGSNMPPNHRDLTSAKYLWDKYISEKSFVQNDFKRQRIFYSGVEFGFGLSDFLKVVNNSYFYTESNGVGKFTNIKWDWESDNVIVDFWIQHTYTDKLKEITSEGV